MLPLSHSFGFAVSRLERRSSRLMAVTPTGPFCPFKSSANQESASEVMDSLNIHTVTPQFASEMSSIDQDLDAGKVPDKAMVLRVYSKMSQTTNRWDRLMDSFQNSPDFQTRERARLLQVHMGKTGTTFDLMGSMMRYKTEVLKALAYDEPLPEPPSDIDIEKIIQRNSEIQASLPKDNHFLTAMTVADIMDCQPFTGNEAAFDSPIVSEEYIRLCEDHASLIEFGATYENFDRIGKLLYLDEIDKIQERWDIFFTRFSLLGALNKDYIDQCDSVFASLGMKEADYRQNLKDCHDLMRKEAERES
jgi:hypothetical protein